MPRDDTQVREYKMPDSDVVQALKHVRARLSDPKRWARGTSFKTAEGRATNNKEEAYSACLGGTMQLLGYDLLMPKMASAITMQAKLDGRMHVSGSIPDFNDAARTTHAVLLDVLDRTIERYTLLR